MISLFLSFSHVFLLRKKEEPQGISQWAGIKNQEFTIAG